MTKHIIAFLLIITIGLPYIILGAIYIGICKGVQFVTNHIIELHSLLEDTKDGKH